MRTGDDGDAPLGARLRGAIDARVVLAVAAAVVALGVGAPALQCYDVLQNKCPT